MQRKFHRVAVLKGGPSSEREVSLRSGAAVAGGLRRAGYEVTEIDVTAPRLELPDGLDGVFIALHGEFGEDGTVQRLLEERRLPYTGSNPEASRASFDKRLSRAVCSAAGLPIPGGELVRAGGRPKRAWPVVIKPPCQGSTIGVHKVTRADEWPAALEDALRYGDEALVEEYVPGRELTVGLLGGAALPVIEVVAPEGWYDYQAKYHSQGRTEYRVPAPLTPDLETRSRRLAEDVFRALGCRGFGRVDFRLRPDDALFVLEMNNIPGFTETSLLPKAARVAGLEFADLCARIMEMATLG
jgi:D-alanine-D-alanine ligase